MDDADIDGEIEHAAATLLGAGWTWHRSRFWLTACPDDAVLSRQGWKLHVSCRANEFADLVGLIVPVLRVERCVFKLAASRRILVGLNDGVTAPATVGKAVTVYPDATRVRAVGLRLAELLRGRHGPRVLSDRQVLPDAPVYYRYGPFTNAWRADARGRLVTRLYGGDGESFDALATLAYRRPGWATDPFTGESEDATAEPDEPLGGRYRIVAGIREAARGNVYRAIDERDGGPAVVKQARALVDEHASGADVRMRLRNERRVLQALDGMAGVPRFIDHFRHGEDEFLVTSDEGPLGLDADVRVHGLYPPSAVSDRPGRDLEALARRLARIVVELHERGVYMRDIAPKNIVVDGAKAGGVSIVDFGFAWYQDFYLPGATRGYAPARQVRAEPPRDTDDLHALGMTLLFATLGIEPVEIGDDLDLPRRRALQALHGAFGERPSGAPGAIADLLAGDADRARAAVRRLAAGTTGDRPAAGPTLAPPRLTEELAAEVAAALLGDLLDQTRVLVGAPNDSQSTYDASVYSGSAGIGLELLRHPACDAVTARLRELAAFTTRAMTTAEPPPGLFVGSTGAALFLREARARGITAGDATRVEVPGPDWVPEGDDLIVGAAGVGLGHLLLHGADGDPAHLAAAGRCVDHVTSRQASDSAYPHDRLPPAAAVDAAAGRAHGVAGVAELLLTYAERTGDTDVLALAAKQVGEVVERCRPLIDRVTHHAPGVVPLAVSWCQGLTGIARTLLHASDALNDPALAVLAGQAGDACATYVPQLSMPGQCCGAAGIGDLLIDLAVHERDERRWAAALRVGSHLLLRSAGPAEHPMFLDPAPLEGSLSWSAGLSGILAFVRRLATRGAGDASPLMPWDAARAGAAGSATA